MASQKRLGFYWGDEKITVADFEKNSPNQVLSAPLGAKNAASPFSSNLTEEIQITAVLKKLLQDNNINDGNFYVSLPMKEIILRSFVIPFVKADDLQNAIKFEAKKYIPFDIQDLSYVFHTIPFMEDQNKRLQVIFFAARKEVLSRYERIFKQLNMAASYAEPYIVSLSKALLFRREIKPTEHLAFLILEKNLGRICFIDKGIPQFIREFPIALANQPDEASSTGEALNLKIVNEVGNSFDFYTRQFSGEKIEQILVSSESVHQGLIEALEAELKLTSVKFSPAIHTGPTTQSSDMDAIYAMGACVAPPLDSLSKFNFIAEKPSKSVMDNEFFSIFKPYKEILITLVVCVVFLIAFFVFLQVKFQLTQHEYDQMFAKEGPLLNETADSLQNEMQASAAQLSQYKGIRNRSDISVIVLRLASHLPVGSMLADLKITYDKGNLNSSHVSIDMEGVVVNQDATSQIAVVNQIFSDFKSDKELAKFINKVELVSINRQNTNRQDSTGFTIHFS